MRRPAQVAATAYVVPWLVGLAVLPAGPDPWGSDAAVSSALSAHAGAAVLQSWLVQAAAVAFVALVHAAAEAVEASRGWRDDSGDSSGGRSRDGAQSGDAWSGPRTAAPVLARLAWLAALASAGVSFLQVAFLHAAVLTADTTRPAVAGAWFHALNAALTLSLLLLLTWAVVAAVRAGRLTGDRVSGHTDPATVG